MPLSSNSSARKNQSKDCEVVPLRLELASSPKTETRKKVGSNPAPATSAALGITFEEFSKKYRPRSNQHRVLIAAEFLLADQNLERFSLHRIAKVLAPIGIKRDKVEIFVEGLRAENGDLLKRSWSKKLERHEYQLGKDGRAVLLRRLHTKKTWDFDGR